MYFKSEEDLKSWLEKKNPQKRINKLAKRFKGKNLLIYGAGMLFRVLIENYDLSGFNTVGISDRSFICMDLSELYNLKTYKPAEIKAVNPDIILLATNYSLFIENFLRDELGLNGTKVINLVEKSLREKFDDFLVAEIKY